MFGAGWVVFVWSCCETDCGGEFVDRGLVGGGCHAEWAWQVGVGEDGQAGGEQSVVNAGEEHRGA